MTRTPVGIALALVAGIALVAAATPAPGAVGVVTGRIVDAETGQPIPSAQVGVQGTRNGVIVPLDGTFTLNEVPTGEQIIVVERLCYHRVMVRVTIGEDTNATVRLDVGMPFNHELQAPTPTCASVQSTRSAQPR